MNTVIKGRAHVFGKNIDTDQIYPGRYLEYTDVTDIKKFAMAGIDEHFAQNFQAGEIIVAGTNFGCGSSREHAAITLKGIGVGAIIADSFARIFFRNAVNLGIPVILCKNISSIIRDGDEISIELEKGLIRNLTTRQTIQAIPLSPYILTIIHSGGIKPMIRKLLTEKSNQP